MKLFLICIQYKSTSDINICLDDIILEVNECKKCLGLNINRILDWNNHVSKITNKLATFVN